MYGNCEYLDFIDELQPVVEEAADLRWSVDEEVGDPRGLDGALLVPRGTVRVRPEGSLEALVFLLLFSEPVK